MLLGLQNASTFQLMRTEIATFLKHYLIVRNVPMQYFGNGQIAIKMDQAQGPAAQVNKHVVTLIRQDVPKSNVR